MKIGFIGLGIMGSRMAANLAHGNHHLLIYNRTREKADSLLKMENVSWKDSPREIAKEAEILFTMLSAPKAVQNVALGNQGFLAAMNKGQMWIDCSTVNPSFSRAMAEECRKRDISFIDAPVAGTLGPAERGELLILAGGEKQDIEKCQPLLDLIGKKTLHVGEAGMGTSLKMVLNLLLGQAMYAFSEAMVLGESLGITRDRLLDALLGSAVVAPFISQKKEKLMGKNQETEFPLQWMHKDLYLVAQTAAETGTFLPAGNLIKEIYQLARSGGYAEKDFSAIYQYIKNLPELLHGGTRSIHRETRSN
jgi:3-hydroxyisobutyrate dehydrogenase-like beta-hydroxyacid dehydrogenase